MAYIPPDLDPASKRAIVDVAKRAVDSTPEAEERSIMDRTDVGGGLLNQDAAQLNESKYGGNVDERALAAINRRESGKYQSALKDLGIRSKHQASQVAMDRKVQAADLLRRENEYNEQIKALRRQAALERKRARASALGSILGIGGAAAGFAFGGGPAGAMAGSMIGQGVGQAAGGGI